MAAETGLVGLTCFLWMLVVLLRHGLYNGMPAQATYASAVLHGALSGLCGFLVQSFFDNMFYSVQLGVLMWLIFGLTAASIKAVGEKHEP
jgi:putative inorganic carbon (HCO3(-)) transporter